MKTRNKTTLIGPLGADPEARETPAGLVVLWRRLAEIARDSLKKGERVYLEGRLQARKWTDASGQERWTTEILAHDLILLGGSPRPSGTQNHPTPRRTPTVPAAPQTPTTPDFADEDLPF